MAQITIINNDEEAYRIFPLIEDFTDNAVSIIPSINFTTLGLIKDSPSYDRGRKTVAVYYMNEGDVDPVVVKSFTDRVVDDLVVGIEIIIEWYCTDGTVGVRKEEFKPLNSGEVQTLLRKRRQRAIDFLRSEAVRTGTEAYIDALFAHYKNEVIAFEETGSDALKTAVEAETDPTILAILNAKPLGLATVKDTILYQIS